MTNSRRRRSACVAGSPEWALFLDLDGTLLEIASEPDAVIVPEGLSHDLAAVRDYLGGALAIVSGRTLREIDDFLSPLKLTCAAEHGADFRFPDGRYSSGAASETVPDSWRDLVRSAARNWPGVVVEDKRHGVAVHYRLAPERAKDVLDVLQSLAGPETGFEVLRARMAFEIRSNRVNKGEAVRRIVQFSPFDSRIPVFVGDDTTDEDGFRAARDLGGLALHVFEVFGGEPANVRQWLRDLPTAGRGK